MQYGFRAWQSTLNAVQEVQKSVDKAFSMKPMPGGFCAAVTLDLTNAFNTANWEHIYQAFNRRLPVYLMRVASSYLENMTLMVETDNGTKEIEITAGVVQGSVGSPTIWKTHYDALLRLILPKDVVLVGYTDDVAMVPVAATIEELEWKCNETLEIASQWMKEHGLKLAQEKSEAVLVTKRRKFEFPKLVLDGHTI